MTTRNFRFGIIDGKKEDCWECLTNTRDLAWYESEEGVNVVCQPCIKKIFAEVGLDWEAMKVVGF